MNKWVGLCAYRKKKKLHAVTAKKNTRLDDFFVHELHVSLLSLSRVTISKSSKKHMSFRLCFSVIHTYLKETQDRRVNKGVRVK